MSRSHRRLAAAVSSTALVLSGAALSTPLTAGAAPLAVGSATVGSSAGAVSPLARPHPPLAAGQKFVSVAVPAGVQTMVYDQHGHLWFWKMPRTTHRWARIGSSTYPRLTPASGNHIFGASGVLLDGIGNAVFILNGLFTGDGDADFLAFGTGPHGWGRLAPRGATLVPTGRGSTDSATPGLALHIQAFHGLLETSQQADVLSVAQGGLLPVNRFYHWAGGTFDLVRDNIRTAVPAVAPLPAGAAIRPVQHCPTALADGVYDASENAVSRNPRQPFGINSVVGVTVKLFDGRDRVCAFTLPATFPISIPMTTAAHRTRWISAPLWVLTTSGSLGDQWGALQQATNLASFRPRGAAPYFIPKTLDVTRLAPTGVDSPVASAIVQITIRHGHLTALTVLQS